ncbi:hypothetical protein Tco_0882621, partial [Tanacetum coccineum]
MSQDVLLTVMNSMSLIGETVNMDGNRKEYCNLEAELLKSQNVFKKAQLQDKDNTISKLKDMIKSMREKSKDENVKYDYCEIETKNVELENSYAKLRMFIIIINLKYAQEQADTFEGIVETAKANNLLDKELDFILIGVFYEKRKELIPSTPTAEDTKTKRSIIFLLYGFVLPMRVSSINGNVYLV